MAHVLERTTFTTSRLMEFCTTKELTSQIGHAPDDWPLVVLKELIDNALDACEEKGISPKIQVKVDTDGITMTDNGPGIPQKTIDGVLDYLVRASSREAYVAPDRGAQGNALKTLVAMPFVLAENDEPGRIDITTKEGRHEIVFSMDPIRQEPTIRRTILATNKVKSGTVITIHWPHSASDILVRAKGRFLQLASDITFLNPHLNLTVNWFGWETEVTATKPNWKKWGPSDPTSPHWYTQGDFERLVAAYIDYGRAHGTDRHVRDLIKEFRGLSGSKKQKSVLDVTGMGRVKLSSLANSEGMDHAGLASLLKAMQDASKVVMPSALGIIGKGHLRQRFVESGIDAKTFTYKKIMAVDNGIPVVIEAAFGLLKDEAGRRRIITGVNWSGAIVNPFQSLGESYRDGLNALLERQLAGHAEPIMFALHLACARVRFSDRGKSIITID